MAIQKTPLPGKVVGCGRMREWLKDRPPEYKDWLIAEIKAFPHLYLCPKTKGNWIYKVECRKCRDAVREKEKTDG